MRNVSDNFITNKNPFYYIMEQRENAHSESSLIRANPLVPAATVLSLVNKYIRFQESEINGRLSGIKGMFVFNYTTGNTVEGGTRKKKITHTHTHLPMDFLMDLLHSLVEQQSSRL